MNKNQRITLMADWWPKACAAQGWNPNDREKRLAILSQIVGRPLQSASELNTTTDIDAVKSRLLALSRPDDLDVQVAITDQPRIRLLYAIRQLGFAPNYIMAICSDRFGLARSDAAEPWSDLPISDLKRLLQTLTNRARAKKQSPVESDNPF